MVSNRFEHPHWHRKLNIVVTALVFIVVGLLLMGREMGLFDPFIVGVIVSWQMLLVVLGSVMLIKRNIVGGFILIGVGFYFLLPELSLGFEWAYSFWPVMLILVGIAILLKLVPRKRHKSNHHHREEKQENNYKTEDGFIFSDVSFGGTKHIVLDPFFKGADIDVSFGSVSLDLRRTKLEGELTFIDIDASFGGIEIFIPSTWNLFIEADTTMSGIDDKRLVSQEIDYTHKLIIRGDITFSGIEIKN
ncbi:DUF5668 domain-containing protein [Parabacteroides sp. PF5-9]|uniref:LiaF transmembrane domain-containing protein n=1 Tax=Parabacteroides sp. PF5-9 TaxID=1742404 RepID=UPI002472FC37|nr:DUF5668 domain-containing protein [Parabacteroides sp. PF5-9]MDH6356867.1 putative membrane protein [Parabacteroides sp. PF5-9]